MHARDVDYDAGLVPKRADDARLLDILLPPSPCFASVPTCGAEDPAHHSSEAVHQLGELNPRVLTCYAGSPHASSRSLARDDAIHLEHDPKRARQASNSAAAFNSFCLDAGPRLVEPYHLSSIAQEQSCSHTSPRLVDLESSFGSACESVPPLGADSKQQRHLLVSPPKGSFVRNSSDSNSNSDSYVHFGCHHSSKAARDELDVHESHAQSSSSGSNFASVSSNASYPACEVNDKQQRHLLVGTSKAGRIRHRSDLSPYTSRASPVVVRNHSITNARDEPHDVLVVASCSQLSARETREEIVYNSSSSAEANLYTPPPTSLSHRPSLRCIHGHHRCAQTGWTISEYCEACHG